MTRSTIYITEEVNGPPSPESPSIHFDAVTVFAPSKSREVSNAPLSDGGFISELLSEKGGRITMEAYVSNHPVVINLNNMIDTTTADSRAQAGWLALNNLYNSRNTVTIVSKYETYNSYFLKNFEPIIMPNDAIGFRMNFEEVRFASEQRVQLLVNMSADKTKESSGYLYKDGGKQPVSDNEIANTLNDLGAPQVIVDIFSGAP